MNTNNERVTANVQLLENILSNQTHDSTVRVRPLLREWAFINYTEEYTKICDILVKKGYTAFVEYGFFWNTLVVKGRA